MGQVIEDGRSWRCRCGARGTLVVQRDPAAPAEGQPFYCPSCRVRLVECRPTRRTPVGKRPLGASADASDMSDDDMQQCAMEWERAQEEVGRLGLMAESHWALDWAERLIREVQRLRGSAPPEEAERVDVDRAPARSAGPREQGD